MTLARGLGESDLRLLTPFPLNPGMNSKDAKVFEDCTFSAFQAHSIGNPDRTFGI